MMDKSFILFLVNLFIFVNSFPAENKDTQDIRDLINKNTCNFPPIYLGSDEKYATQFQPCSQPNGVLANICSTIRTESNLCYINGISQLSSNVTMELFAGKESQQEHLMKLCGYMTALPWTKEDECPKTCSDSFFICDLYVAMDKVLRRFIEKGVQDYTHIDQFVHSGALSFMFPYPPRGALHNPNLLGNCLQATEDKTVQQLCSVMGEVAMRFLKIKADVKFHEDETVRKVMPEWDPCTQISAFTSFSTSQDFISLLQNCASLCKDQMGICKMVYLGLEKYQNVTAANPEQPVQQPTGTVAGKVPPAEQPTGAGIGQVPPAEQPTGTGIGQVPPAEQPTGTGIGQVPPAEQPTGTGIGQVPPAEQPTGTSIGQVPPAEQPTGSGIGQVLPAQQPTGTGIGQVPPAEQPNGSGIGRVPPAQQPTGSGIDQVPPAEQPTGSGIGQVLPAQQPTGTGIGQVPPAQQPTGTGIGQVPPAQQPTGTGIGQVPPAQQPTGTGIGQVPPAEQPTGTGIGQVPPAQQPTGTGIGQVPPAQQPTGTATGQVPPAEQPSGTATGQVQPVQQPSGTDTGSEQPAEQPSGTDTSQVQPVQQPTGTGSGSGQTAQQQPETDNGLTGEQSNQGGSSTTTARPTSSTTDIYDYNYGLNEDYYQDSVFRDPEPLQDQLDPKPAENTDQKKPQQTKLDKSVGYAAGDEDSSGGHFMAYFLVFIVLSIAGYIIFHNKQKIIALVIEGKTAKGGRRPNTKDYKQVKTDDVMPDLEKSAYSKNYVF